MNAENFKVNNCKAQTTRKKPCKLKAKGNGYCWRHQPPVNKKKRKRVKKNLKKKEPIEDCVICLIPLKDNVMDLDCGHCFHKDCIQQTADKAQETRTQLGYPLLKMGFCPICRRDIKQIKPRAVEIPSCNSEVRDVELSPMEIHQLRTSPLADLQDVIVSIAAGVQYNNHELNLAEVIQLCTVLTSTLRGDYVPGAGALGYIYRITG